MGCFNRAEENGMRASAATRPREALPDGAPLAAHPRRSERRTHRESLRVGSRGQRAKQVRGELRGPAGLGRVAAGGMKGAEEGRAKLSAAGALTATGYSSRRIMVDNTGGVPCGDAAQTSSFLAPMRVRSRSAKRAASNGFLNVSLMLERSKLVELPSSGSKAIRITSAKALLRRRF